ncbi:hypothetical protein [Pontibacter sp. G13]|uniref:hypothetical protein n=1 Tax=Pontibacter sp. G13 TaxID=3074898 RepID=UPI002889A10F|nr:hypothetical protein [Pontibacter sp. G13]WNJ20223.1 hypothetical protein RJD25_07060 [Pontibacter sp. G13]
MKHILLLAIPLVFGCQTEPAVHISETSIDAPTIAWEIQTSSATWMYQPEAGGFSHLIDDTGTDWIQFSPADHPTFPASAANAYRGLPNLVHRGADHGSGHPGFAQMSSEITAPNEITSTSNSGHWRWRWSFHSHFAVLTIERADSTHPYWFLYEGPVAGHFSPNTHFWGTEHGGPNISQPNFRGGGSKVFHAQTVYIGDRSHDRTLFIHQITGDSLPDMLGYLGNDSTELAASDGMAVLGFGRSSGAKPSMTLCQSFIVGVYGGPIEHASDHDALLQYIRSVVEQSDWENSTPEG